MQTCLVASLPAPPGGVPSAPLGKGGAEKRGVMGVGENIVRTGLQAGEDVLAVQPPGFGIVSCQDPRHATH